MSQSKKPPPTMTRKTTQFKPELNSLLRLGHQVNTVKTQLKNANSGKALGLAKDKLLDSPNTNKGFRKTVAKRVDFGSEEKLFNQLTKLDLSENSDPVQIQKSALKKKSSSVPSCKRDPEPRLSDFHEPFQGQPMPSVQDSDEMMSKIVKDYYKQDKDWPDKFRASRKKFQDTFKR